ncbi:hypothetical protein [Pengzhenrongella frigida]|uniref:hypothetical protein n=1 Tax=Pengzhenrongella frigida TaxID=1259133 RepID=UPI001A92C48F|nr:hypothetical protein [Cellulomonas sp. HLT2-17]
MRRHVPAGVFLAVLASLLILLSDTLGLEAQSVTLLGAGLGGALGLVPDRTPVQRLGGFAVGFAAAWLGYLLRAAVLPDAASGRAVAVLVVLLGCLAVAMATRGRLPLWATLLGASAMAGSYESVYVLDPTSFLTTSPSSATAVLVAAGAGFLATALLAPQIERDRSLEKARHTVAAAPSPSPALPIHEEAALLFGARPLESTTEA